MIDFPQACREGIHPGRGSSGFTHPCASNLWSSPEYASLMLSILDTSLKVLSMRRRHRPLRLLCISGAQRNRFSNMVRLVGHVGVDILDVDLMEKVIVQHSTAGHVSDLELFAVGTELPHVIPGPVQADSAAFSLPQHLSPLLCAHILELETARKSRGIEGVSLPAQEAVLISAARARLAQLDG